MGYDMFDCVLPTRNARNGERVHQPAGGSRSSMPPTRATNVRSIPHCECRCLHGPFPRAYLRHLYLAGEILAARALTEHNLFSTPA